MIDGFFFCRSNCGWPQRNCNDLSLFYIAHGFNKQCFQHHFLSWRVSHPPKMWLSVRNHKNISLTKVCRLAVEMINYSSRFRNARCGWQAGRERAPRGRHRVDCAGRARRPRRPHAGRQGNNNIALCRPFAARLGQLVSVLFSCKVGSSL